MKNLLILFTYAFSFFAQSQSIEGSWQLTHRNGRVVDDVYVKIFMEGYFAYGGKQKADHTFLSAGGGVYTLRGNQYTETLDFFTQNAEYVGKTFSYEIKIEANQMEITSLDAENPFTEKWLKLSDNRDDLTGNWVITGRKRDGEVSTQTPGARRTVKILAGGRFQWIAFNSQTKAFMGTGGGTYNAVDGNYTENIDFFSRDKTRVGAKLDFNFEIIDGHWHHSGKSSKGDPIYEIWSDYQTAYLYNRKIQKYTFLNSKVHFCNMITHSN